MVLAEATETLRQKEVRLLRQVPFSFSSAEVPVTARPGDEKSEETMPPRRKSAAKNRHEKS